MERYFRFTKCKDDACQTGIRCVYIKVTNMESRETIIEG